VTVNTSGWRGRQIPEYFCRYDDGDVPLPDSAESNLPGEAGAECWSSRGRAAHGLMLAVSTGMVGIPRIADVRKDIDR
jgi:hypothetical protein